MVERGLIFKRCTVMRSVMEPEEGDTCEKVVFLFFLDGVTVAFLTTRRKEESRPDMNSSLEQKLKARSSESAHTNNVTQSSALTVSLIPHLTQSQLSTVQPCSRTTSVRTHSVLQCQPPPPPLFIYASPNT